MDFYGEINLKQNAMQQMVVQTETNFPETPVVGRVVFKDAKLYMCVAINNLIPVWLPLTNKIDTYVHSEAVASTTWTVNHGMNTTIPLIQVYDEEGEMLIPESATPLDNNNMTITFNVAVSGTAIVLFGELIPQSGVGLLEPEIVASFVLTFTLDNPDVYGSAVNDFFGGAVAIDGNNCIVGAIGEDDIEGNNSGKAYIFNVTTGALIHTLDNPNPIGASSSDFFGKRVAISGNNCVVTAPSEDVGGSGSGIAYIFNVTTGALLQTINNPNSFDAFSGDNFGESASISGNNVIVGAPNEDDAVGGSTGIAYIFNVTTGALLQTLDNPTPSAADTFGDAVSISGNNCIVGARRDDADGNNSGKAYIFNVTTGALIHTLDNPSGFGTNLDDNFGNAVSIDGNNCIVGAEGEDETGSSQAGKVYVFNVTTGALIQTIDAPTGDNYLAKMGDELDLSGDKCILSRNPYTYYATNDAQQAFVFDINTGALLLTIDNPNPEGSPEGDTFSTGVGIDGDNVIVGAPNEDEPGENNSGKAYLYTI